MQNKNFIKITSPNQFEIRAGYLSGDKKKKKIDYNINIYMFIPKNLGINSTTYTQNDFYSDYISYIRLITPRCTITSISQKIEDILSSIKKKRDNREKLFELFHQLKMSVCSYITYLRRYIEHLQNRDEVNEKRVVVLLKRIKKFNKLKQSILGLRDISDNEDLIFLAESASEYLSLTTQHYLFKLNIYLDNSRDDHFDLINCIVSQINHELKFCKKNGFPIISNDEYNNENVIFRYSVLKKYFYSVLFLNQKREEDGKSIKEFYYAIAAGISMVFTTIIVFATQKEYGNFTLSFFTALVVSYMFKDRIKEGYRKYFDKKLQLKTFDFKEKIYDNQERRLFAFIKERMRFIKKNELNRDVVKTRLISTSSRLSTWYLGENIFKYEKHITLYNKNLQEYYSNKIEGIHNIMRFDVSKFLKKMDAPKVPLYRMNNNKLFGEKVYHVNIVIEFISENEKKLHKARLILTKKGIKRIEIPEFDIKILRQNKLSDERIWFAVKKSGLVKKIGN